MSENNPAAYCFYKTFEPEPPKSMCFDRHYLLYAAKGALRLEVEDRHWVLPPMRAAWIPANTPIVIEIPHEVTCCSILFDPQFIRSKIAECRVLNLNTMTREMILHTRRWGPDMDILDAHAISFFRALAGICSELADQPSEVWIPKGNTKELKRALAFTRKNIANALTLREVAAAANLSPRSLARRFANETNMTWRQFQRRMRMIHAMELLCNVDGKIINIAYDVGYVSLSAFNRAFLEFSGITPSLFRRRYFANSPENMDEAKDLP